ncbi:MAG TPA: hypothetical protein VHE35_06025 [Kofleriaceae bacterium]|nr:hypothetical protein [Kofleriaceae bacterium]
MATSKSSGLGGFNNQLGLGKMVGAVGDTEPEGGSLPELQGNLRDDDDTKETKGDEASEEHRAQRVGSARVGDEEDLDQDLDRLDNGDLDDDEQRIDPALDADIEGGE